MKNEWKVDGDQYKLERAIKRLRDLDREESYSRERANTVHPDRRRLKDLEAGRRRHREHKYQGQGD